MRLGTFSPPHTSGYQTTGSLNTNVSNIISNIIGIITVVAGVAFIFYFLIGAFNWITSGGDTQKIQKASQQVYNALIGIVIVAAAYAIIYIILTYLLKIPFANPGELFRKLEYLEN